MTADATSPANLLDRTAPRAFEVAAACDELGCASRATNFPTTRLASPGVKIRVSAKTYSAQIQRLSKYGHRYRARFSSGEGTSVREDRYASPNTPTTIVIDCAD